MGGSGREYYIKIRLSEDEYERLKEAARNSGFTNLPEYVRWVLTEHLESPRAAAQASIDQEALKRALQGLERRIMDLLNPFTGKIDEVNLKLSQIIEMLETQGTPTPASRPVEQQLPRPAPRRYGGEYQARERQEQRGDALSRLREEGVLFQEDAGWIRAPEKFFASLEKRGAVVMKLGEDFVAIDRGFWERFRRLIEELDVADSLEAERLVGEEMGEKASRLFRKMVRAGLAVFDEDKGQWLLYLPP